MKRKVYRINFNVLFLILIISPKFLSDFVCFVLYRDMLVCLYGRNSNIVEAAFGRVWLPPGGEKGLGFKYLWIFTETAAVVRVTSGPLISIIYSRLRI